jgi:hypothetical protein
VLGGLQAALQLDHGRQMRRERAHRRYLRRFEMVGALRPAQVEHEASHSVMTGVDAVETVHRPDEIVVGRAAREIGVGDDRWARRNADRHRAEQRRHEANPVWRKHAREVALVDAGACHQRVGPVALPDQHGVVGADQVDDGREPRGPFPRRRSCRIEPLGCGQNVVRLAHIALARREYRQSHRNIAGFSGPTTAARGGETRHAEVIGDGVAPA